MIVRSSIQGLNTWLVISDRITQDETLFTYGSISRKKRQADLFECTSFENCGNSSISPVTLDELTFTDEQRAMCMNDETCLFDLAVTGDEDFAVTTLESSEEDARVQQLISEICIGMTQLIILLLLLLGNDPPSIAGESMFLVTVGEENVYTFSVNDSNDFNVTVEGGVPDGGVLSDDGDGNYTFTWTLETVPNITGLPFLATDVAGAASVISPSVLLCACFNGGECVVEGVSIDMPVLTLSCLCDEGIHKKLVKAT